MIDKINEIDKGLESARKALEQQNRQRKRGRSIRMKLQND